MEAAVCKSNTKRIAVVTGANKGVGLEICKQLASHGVMVLLTARDEGRGIEAVEKLKSSGVSDIVFHQLDVSDPSSIASLATFIKTNFGKLDILVNNAGVSGVTVDDQALASSLREQQGGWDSVLKLMQESYENAQECLDINYHGIKRVTEALIPLLLLAQSPRIVNVSSFYGKLRFITNEIIKKELDDAERLTEERLHELLQSFLHDFKEGKLEENGWPTSPSAYKVSKIAVCSYTRVLAKRYPTFVINCVNPGFVKTDINMNTGTLTVEVGAEGPVMLALLPDGSPSGLFYDQTNMSSFE